jgi:hypothetical protein
MAEEVERTAEFYRIQAEQMLLRASRVHSPELRARYLDLAMHWSQLAELCEKTAALRDCVEDESAVEKYQPIPPAPPPGKAAPE